jgi:hypothetical protein
MTWARGASGSFSTTCWPSSLRSIAACTRLRTSFSTVVGSNCSVVIWSMSWMASFSSDSLDSKVPTGTSSRGRTSSG